MLEILTNHHGAVRGLVSPLSRRRPPGGGLDGLADTSRPVRYQVGEGYGKVVEWQADRRPASAASRRSCTARAAELAHQELSFICVPIVLNRRTIGARAIDLKFKPERTFDAA